MNLNIKQCKVLNDLISKRNDINSMKEIPTRCKFPEYKNVKKQHQYQHGDKYLYDPKYTITF